jgi:hypothetical protein
MCSAARSGLHTRGGAWVARSTRQGSASRHCRDLRSPVELRSLSKLHEYVDANCVKNRAGSEDEELPDYRDTGYAYT